MSIVVPKDQLSDYIGKDLGHSEWVTIDQGRIDRFAEVTLDDQYIHTDPERAAQTPFGTTIAHGFLTLSLMSHLVQQVSLGVENMVMGINYGCESVRFLTPVKVNSRIRANVRVANVQEKSPTRHLITSDVTMEIENEDKPALVAQWLTLLVSN